MKLEAEFEAAFRSLAWIRNVLEQELGQDMRTSDGRVVVDNATLSKWNAYIKALDTLGAAHTRFSKNAKAHADSMTPDEELEAVRAYVRAMDPKSRGKFLRDETEWHETNR